MESFGNIIDEEWHSLYRMFITDEGSDQFAKQLGLMSTPCDLGLNFKIPNIFFSESDDNSNVNSFVADDEHLVNVSCNINPSFYHFFCQENSISNNDPDHESFQFCPSSVIPSLSNDVGDQSIEFRTMNEINNSSPTTQLFSEGNLYMTQDLALEKVRMENPLVSSRETDLKRKFETPVLPDAVDDDVNNDETDKNLKKRIRVSRDNKNRKNVQPKKNQKMNDTEERNKKNNGEINGKSSSSCCSSDDINVSQDSNGASNINGNTRASRGTATDPQSLYARKRRERINERLRILQNLIPNGTKVDISTMLEEAVEYVKFLKLQIQLLSSDDMWMYAPIAYNGMDMGLYQNISQNIRI